MIWLAPFPLLFALAGCSSPDPSLGFFSSHIFFSYFGMAFWVLGDANDMG